LENEACDVHEDRPEEPEALRPPQDLVRELVQSGIIAKNARWFSLPGGRTNRVWYLSQKGRPSVVKLYATAADTPLFRNDPDAEMRALRVLGKKGLSPAPIHAERLTCGTVLVYTHQPGVPWRRGVARVAHVMKKLHNLPIPPTLAQLPPAPDGSAPLIRQTLDILAQVGSQRADPLLAAQPRWEVVPSNRIRLLHGDPIPDNLICSADDDESLPMLIDWQCPALGDPALDLGLFLSPAMQQVYRGYPLSDAERDGFLSAYDDASVIARLTALQPFLHWRMAAYCLWKITRDPPDQAYAAGLSLELAALQRCQ
jgi:thiamine kinase